MHTTLQGPAPLEVGLQQFVFIKVRGYYTRAELNAAKRARPVPPGACANMLNHTAPCEHFSPYDFYTTVTCVLRVCVTCSVSLSPSLSPGHRVPDFGAYIEKGGTRENGLPRPRHDGRAKFTASQSLHWIEHGTAVMIDLFERKVPGILHAYLSRMPRTTHVTHSCYTLMLHTHVTHFTTPTDLPRAPYVLCRRSPPTKRIRHG